jgi:hypothetical protein
MHMPHAGPRVFAGHDKFIHHLRRLIGAARNREKTYQ